MYRFGLRLCKGEWGKMVTKMARSTADKHPDLDYVLLCLMRIHPDVSGYQIRNIIDDCAGYLFHAHLSQIYPALRRLSDAGLASYSEVAREGKPDLKLYRATRTGERRADEWLRRPYSFEPTRTSFDRYFLRLLLMGHLDDANLASYLDTGIAGCVRMREKIRAIDMEEELAHISDGQPRVSERYRLLWGTEIDFALEDLERRIELLEKLRASL